jgi:hypothetical protein
MHGRNPTKKLPSEMTDIPQGINSPFIAQLSSHQTRNFADEVAIRNDLFRHRLADDL